jgi:integrase
MREHIETNGLGPEDFCFTQNGKPIRPEHAETVFYRALVKSGILPMPENKKIAPVGRRKELSTAADGRKLVVHSLRYTYVTRMRRELSVETVMKMVGHVNPEQTDYYTSNRFLDECIAALTGAGEAADNLFI